MAEETMISARVSFDLVVLPQLSESLFDLLYAGRRDERISTSKEKVDGYSDPLNSLNPLVLHHPVERRGGNDL